MSPDRHFKLSIVILILTVCSILDEERRANQDLKQTWEMANDKFLESQRLNMMDMRRMETVLTAEQQRQIAGKHRTLSYCRTFAIFNIINYFRKMFNKSFHM